MKKTILALIGCVITSLAGFAQSGWTDPSPSYHAQTVIYATVDCGNFPLSENAEVAAFVDGELRALSAEPQYLDEGLRIYALRIGGDNAEDKGKNVQFKLYEPSQQLAYPLQCNADVKWQGDVSLNQPSDYVVLSFNPIATLSLVWKTETKGIVLKPEETASLHDFVEIACLGADGQPATLPEASGMWTYDGDAQYLTLQGTQVHALKPTPDVDHNGTPDPVYVAYRMGNLVSENVPVLILTDYVAVEHIAVENIIAYKGQTGIIPQVTYNQGLSEPSMPGVTFTSHNKDIVQVLKDAAGNESLSMVGFGKATLTATAVDNSAVTATFEVEVRSALTTFSVKPEVLDWVLYTETEDITSQMQLQLSGLDVQVDYSAYTVVTDRAEVLRVQETEDGFSFIACGEGTAILTFTSSYDPSISATCKVNVDRYVRVEQLFVESIVAYKGQDGIVPAVTYNNGLSQPEHPGVTYTSKHPELVQVVKDAAGKETLRMVGIGTATLVATAIDNTEVTDTFEVKVLSALTSFVVTPETLQVDLYTEREDITSSIEVQLSGLDIEVDYTGYGITTDHAEVVRVETTAGQHRLVACGDGVATLTFTSSYDSSLSATCVVTVTQKYLVHNWVTFNPNGWDWIYIPGVLSLFQEDLSYTSVTEGFDVDEDNKVIEIRSQKALLYNDKDYGFFGSIDELTGADGMYKIKASYANEALATIDMGETWDAALAQTKPIRKGYNWIGYPNKYYLTLEGLNAIVAQNIDLFREGDLIIGKESFAEFNGRVWIAPSGFELVAGKGYIYYSENGTDADQGIDFSLDEDDSTPSVKPQVRVARAKDSKGVWHYNTSEFADNMAVVLMVEGLENPEQYTIGAFVNDECRGMGAAVEGGRMMVNVAGRAGETVEFRLHHSTSGEYFNLNGHVGYAQHAGSLKAPVMLSLNDQTSIEEILAVGSDTATEIYDIHGRKVERMQAGNLYIVRQYVNGKMQTRKVIMK